VLLGSIGLSRACWVVCIDVRVRILARRPNVGGMLAIKPPAIKKGVNGTQAAVRSLHSFLPVLSCLLSFTIIQIGPLLLAHWRLASRNELVGRASGK
jgi:hypothetical protein